MDTGHSPGDSGEKNIPLVVELVSSSRVVLVTA